MYQLAARVTSSTDVELHHELNLIDFEIERDRAAAFYDGAIVEYTDAPIGSPADRYDVYAPEGAQRIGYESRRGENAIAGAAERLVERAWGRATPGSATATVQLGLLPGQRPTITTPSHTRSATISSITHEWPAAESRLELRDIIIE